MGAYVRKGDKIAAISGVARNDLVSTFQKTLTFNMLYQQLESFPYMIVIFAPCGTAVYINRAGYKEIDFADHSLILGRYNMLNDTVAMDVLGYRDIVRRAFLGECMITHDVRLPTDRYSKDEGPFIKVVYQTVSTFPIWDEDQQLAYIGMVFVTTRTYEGRTEIVKVLEYLDSNWTEKFNMEKLANIANLSVYHFARMFKQYKGMTPLDYYRQVKINRLCEELRNPNLSVTQAFAACGVDIKSRYMQYFKENIGLTPAEYKRENQARNS